MLHPLNHQVAKRQVDSSVTVPTVDNFSGSVTATTGVDLGTSLLLGTSETSTPAATDQLVPGQTAVTVTSSSTPTQTNASSSSSSSHSSPSVSTGAVVGIAIGVFLIIVGAMFAVYSYFKRRTLLRARRTVAHGPPRVVRGPESAKDPSRERQGGQKGGNDRGEGKNKSYPGGAKGKRPDSGNLALFEKELSVRSASDEKVTVSDHHSFDPSSMPNFVKYHPYLTDDLSNLPPPNPDQTPVVSWDASTASADQLLSLRASASDTMSPTAAVIARQTPQATDSVQHRWESAEVLIMDDHTAERPSVYSDMSYNPFHDSSAPRPSMSGNDSDSRTGGNPFFNAAQHNPFSDRSTRSRKSSVSTAKRSRANSVSSGVTVRPAASEGALLSLIAALDHPPMASEYQGTRTSLQTVTTSIYAPTEPDVPMPAPKAF